MQTRRRGLHRHSRFVDAFERLEKYFGRYLQPAGIVPGSGNDGKGIRLEGLRWITRNIGEIERSRLRELWMVEGVERFDPELNPYCLGNREVLEDGGVQIVEGRATSLLGTSAQNRVVCLSDRRCLCGVGEGARIEPLCAIMRSGVPINARDDIRVAAEARGCTDWATEGKGLTALIAVNEVC